MCLELFIFFRLYFLCLNLLKLFLFLFWFFVFVWGFLLYKILIKYEYLRNLVLILIFEVLFYFCMCFGKEVLMSCKNILVYNRFFIINCESLCWLNVENWILIGLMNLFRFVFYKLVFGDIWLLFYFFILINFKIDVYWIW